MCLIVYSPNGLPTDYAVMAEAQKDNPDGIGVMSRSGVRRFLGPKMLKRAVGYVAYLAGKAEPYAIHFRYATHGAKDLSNTHPHESDAGLAVMHNGVLSGFANKASASDTSQFVSLYLRGVRDLSDCLPLLERAIGYGNKFCVYSRELDKFWLANEDEGTWYEGIWYSQTYSLPWLMLERMRADGAITWVPQTKTVSYSPAGDWGDYEDRRTSCSLDGENEPGLIRVNDALYERRPDGVLTYHSYSPLPRPSGDSLSGKSAAVSAQVFESSGNGRDW